MIRRASEGGFTLIELILALSLSTFVLVGIVSVTASVLRHHFDQIRRGEANVQTLYSLQQLNVELEEATHIVPNYPPTTGSSVLKGCKNYSARLVSIGDGTGRYDTTRNSEYFVYCVRSDGNDSSGNAMYSLIRYAGTTCSSMGNPEAACGSGGTFSVVALNRFYPQYPATNYFFRTNDRRVRVSYILGVSTPTTNVPNPVFFRVDTTISPEKPYWSVGTDVD